MSNLFHIWHWLQAQSCSPCGLENPRQTSEMCLIRWANSCCLTCGLSSYMCSSFFLRPLVILQENDWLHTRVHKFGVFKRRILLPTKIVKNDYILKCFPCECVPVIKLNVHHHHHSSLQCHMIQYEDLMIKKHVWLLSVLKWLCCSMKYGHCGSIFFKILWIEIEFIRKHLFEI